MHFVLLVILVATVYGKDPFDAGYYPGKPYGGYERHHINSPPPEIPERRYEENDPNRDTYENYRPVDLNINRQVFNNENNRELFNNDRNGRRNQFPNADRSQTHGVIRDMDINLAFERQGPKRHRESNMNLPKQSFSVNNEYSKRVDTNDNSNRSYNRNIPTQRDDGDMVFRNSDEDGHDKRKTPARPNNNNSYNNEVPDIGIISFLNHVDVNSNKEMKTQPNDSSNNQSGLKFDTTSNTEQRPSKTTIENEVTPNPFRRDPNVKEIQTIKEDKWVWGDESKTDIETTTDMTTLQPLDNRAVFEGGKCATGMARIQGKCVDTD